MAEDDLLNRISIIPGICGGKPVVRGMRITVSSILELLAGGMTENQILADYPYLEHQDIQACLNYAAKLSSYSAVQYS